MRSICDLLTTLLRSGGWIEYHEPDRLRIHPGTHAGEDLRRRLAPLKQDLLRLIQSCRGEVQGCAYRLWLGETLPGKYLACDTETTLIENGEVPQLALLTASNRRDTVLVHPDLVGLFLDLHRDRDLVFHNAVFDFWVLDLHLWDRPRSILWEVADQGRLHCSLILDQLVQVGEGGSPTRRNLGELSRIYGGPVLDKGDEFRFRYAELIDADWSTADPRFWHYAVMDPIATAWIFSRLWKRSQELVHPFRNQLLPDAQRRFGVLTETMQVKASLALDAIERLGLQVDQQQVQSVAETLQSRRDELQQSLTRNTPGLFRRTKREGRLVLTGATHKPAINQKVLREKLTEVLPGIEPPITECGKESVAAEFWKQHRDKDQFVDQWCEFEEVAKLQQFVSKLDQPRIHPRYELLTRTGRVSCRSPNVQQVPRRPEFRKMICAAPGHTLIIVDYASVELRTLAAILEAMFGSSRLADVLRQGVDPHAFTASLLLGMSLDDFLALKQTDPDQFKRYRQASKAINFGCPAGLGPASLQSYAKTTFGVELTLDEATRFRRDLTEKVYPEIGRYLLDTGAKAICTLTGRVRSGVTFCNEKNSRFSGLAACGIKQAMWRLLKAGWSVVGMVHDELIVEVPDDIRLDLAAAEIVWIMCQAMQELTGTIPVECEYAISKVWQK